MKEKTPVADEVATRISSIRNMTGKLSSSGEIEDLEKNLYALDAAIRELRNIIGSSPGEGRRRRPFEGASPSIESPDKLDRGPEAASDPSAI